MNRSHFLWVLFLLLVPLSGSGEDLPRQGTFTGFFFVDRWRQPVFDIFYVDSGFTEDLQGKGWRPLRIEAKEIHQPANPGGAMIRQIDKVHAVGGVPLEIELRAAANRVRFGDTTELHVVIKNVSDAPIDPHGARLDLSVTIHERGRLLAGYPPRDEIYDCGNDIYWPGLGELRYLRSTHYMPLFTQTGEIAMDRGAPHLYIMKEGKRKHAWVSDKVKHVVAAGKDSTFTYTIGAGWFLNEYELQVRYQPPSPGRVPYILSKPISFDVTR